jgi:hypothetical protein
MRTVLSILSAALLSGCAAMSLENLRDDPHASLDFDVEKSYQQVYSTALQRMRQCYMAKPLRSQLTVSDKRDNATKTGYITVKYLFDATGETYFLLVDVTAMNENRTHVKVSYAPSTKDDDAAAVREWLQNDATTCKTA